MRLYLSPTLKILAIGDSHTATFSKNINFEYSSLPDFNVTVKAIKMASARGLSTGSPTTNSVAIIDANLDVLGMPDYLCLNFGQVDAEFGFYYKTILKREPLDFEQYSTKIVQAYVQACDKYKSRTKALVIKGINLPTISSRNRATFSVARQIGVIGRHSTYNKSFAKRLVKRIESRLPEYSERCARVRFFNGILQKECNKYDISYFDINGEIFDETNNTIRPEFLPVSSLDHHVALTAKVSEFCISKLLATSNI